MKTEDQSVEDVEVTERADPTCHQTARPMPGEPGAESYREGSSRWICKPRSVPAFDRILRTERECL
jgi:hypothetical protein